MLQADWLTNWLRWIYRILPASRGSKNPRRHHVCRRWEIFWNLSLKIGLFQHFQISWNLEDKNHENVISTNYLKEKWVKGSWTLPCLYDIALHGKRKISKIDQSNPIWWREGGSLSGIMPIVGSRVQCPPKISAPAYIVMPPWI